MQALGISDSSSRSEGRLKSLFWPSIDSGVDVEYLAVQGYWICSVVAAFSFAGLFFTRQPVLGMVVFLFFHLGAVGVREHSRFAAAVVFVFYVIDMLASFPVLVGSPGMIVMRVIITALLLSNLRATFISAQWQSGSDEAAMPPRLYDTIWDKFANRWPSWIWPKIKIVYYIFSIGLLLLFAFGLMAMFLRQAR